MLDLEAEERPFDIAETKQMQMMKTGHLFHVRLYLAVLLLGLVNRYYRRKKLTLAILVWHFKLPMICLIMTVTPHYWANQQAKMRPVARLGLLRLWDVRQQRLRQGGLFMTRIRHLRHGKMLLNICSTSQNSQLRVKQDNLRVMVVGRQVPITLNIGLRRTALSDTYSVSCLPTLKIWDNRPHAHTVA